MADELVYRFEPFPLPARPPLWPAPSTIWRPVVHLALRSPRRTIRMSAVLDTGSDVAAFDARLLTTWRRLIRQRGWQRPRRRLYPAKPKLGLRATRPGEYIHIDVTILKLLDGTRAYIHAAIDNFSRKILAWKVAERLEPASTCEVLVEAGQAAGLLPPVTVIADSGVENVNRRVDALIEAGLVRRVLAQVQVSFSNSMIEAFWRSLKHRWLYLHLLDNLDQVRRLVAFYVQQHNEVVPHPAFRGQTPDEIFFGTGDDIPAQLAAARTKARAARIATGSLCARKGKGALSCGACRSNDDPG